MSITAERKEELIKEFATTAGDTGFGGCSGCDPDGTDQ